MHDEYRVTAPESWSATMADSIVRVWHSMQLF